MAISTLIKGNKTNSESSIGLRRVPDGFYQQRSLWNYDVPLLALLPTQQPHLGRHRTGAFSHASFRAWPSRIVSKHYEAMLIRETSMDTRIVTTDAMNTNVAATAPIERNGFLSTSRDHRSQLTSFFAAEEGAGDKQGDHIQPHPDRRGETGPEENIV
jgi:hypothetical protein